MLPILLLASHPVFNSAAKKLFHEARYTLNSGRFSAMRQCRTSECYGYSARIRKKYEETRALSLHLRKIISTRHATGIRLDPHGRSCYRHADTDVDLFSSSVLSCQGDREDDDVDDTEPSMG